jgi:hypothetical protein
MPSVSDIHARRTKELHRAFKSELPVKLTISERAVLDRAVRLTVKAELAAADPSTDLNDIFRIENLAARSRAAWSQVVSARRHRSAPSLQSLMAGHGIIA